MLTIVRVRVQANASVAFACSGRAWPLARTSCLSHTNHGDVDAVFEGKGVTGVVVALGRKTSDVGMTMLQDGTAHTVSAVSHQGSFARD